MQHVTTLLELEAQMSRLTHTRNMAIEAAEAMIDQANREFDTVALPLGREINKVRKAVEAQAPKPSVTRARAARQVKVLAGMDEDEQQYFQQLKKKVKK